MATAVVCLVSWLLPVLLSVTSALPDRGLQCVARNLATGRPVPGAIVQVGAYAFDWRHPSCSSRRQKVKSVGSLRDYSLRLRFQAASSLAVCPSQVRVHSVNFIGSVDLCKNLSHPETFQVSSQEAVLSVATLGEAQFIMELDYVSDERTVRRIATDDWTGLTSPGYPASYPNFMDVTYSFVAPFEDCIVELMTDDMMLGDPFNAACEGDFLEVMDGDEVRFWRRERWCQGQHRFLSSSQLVTAKFHSDSSLGGRGFSLRYRTRKNPEMRSREEIRMMKHLATCMLLVYLVMICVRVWEVRKQESRQSRLGELASTILRSQCKQQSCTAAEKSSAEDLGTLGKNGDCASRHVSLISDDIDFHTGPKWAESAIYSLLPLQGEGERCGCVTFLSLALLLAYFGLLVAVLVHCSRLLFL